MGGLAEKPTQLFPVSWLEAPPPPGASRPLWAHHLLQPAGWTPLGFSRKCPCKATSLLWLAHRGTHAANPSVLSRACWGGVEVKPGVWGLGVAPPPQHCGMKTPVAAYTAHHIPSGRGIPQAQKRWLCCVPMDAWNGISRKRRGSPIPPWVG